MKIVKKIFRFLLFATPVLGIVSWWGIEKALPKWPIKPMRANPEKQHWRLPQGANPSDYGLMSENFDIISHDSLLLKGLFIPSKTKPLVGKPLTIILVHGISGCKEHYLPAAKRFAELGYSCLIFDQRAHGQSQGEYCTFGANEKRDVSAFVDALLLKNPTQTIGIYGNSLGGAVAIQALASDKRLKFGIIESTFNTLEKVVQQYGKHYMGINSHWLAVHTLEKSATIAHFDPFSVKPCEAARQIEQPVFMAHGDKDERIPIAFGEENFRNLASKDKEWTAVHGAGHIGMWQTGGEAYFQKIKSFLERQSVSP